MGQSLTASSPGIRVHAVGLWDAVATDADEVGMLTAEVSRLEDWHAQVDAEAELSQLMAVVREE